MDDRTEILRQLLDDADMVSGFFRSAVPGPILVRNSLSPVMRKWFVDGLVYRIAQFYSDLKLEFLADRSEYEIKLCEDGYILWWMETIYLNDVGLSCGLPRESVADPAGFRRVRAEQSRISSGIFCFNPKEFVDQKMFYWNDGFITRGDAIKTYANKAGGTHLDINSLDVNSPLNAVRRMLGCEVLFDNVQLLVGNELSEAKKDPIRRRRVYDAMELLIMDTARIFADTINKIRPRIIECI